MGREVLNRLKVLLDGRWVEVELERARRSVALARFSAGRLLCFSALSLPGFARISPRSSGEEDRCCDNKCEVRGKPEDRRGPSCAEVNLAALPRLLFRQRDG